MTYLCWGQPVRTNRRPLQDQELQATGERHGWRPAACPDQRPPWPGLHGRRSQRRSRRRRRMPPQWLVTARRSRAPPRHPSHLHDGDFPWRILTATRTARRHPQSIPKRSSLPACGSTRRRLDAVAKIPVTLQTRKPPKHEFIRVHREWALNVCAIEIKDGESDDAGLYVVKPHLQATLQAEATQLCASPVCHPVLRAALVADPAPGPGRQA